MRPKLTLTKHYRGFDAETEFQRVAEYGSWHPAAAKLETVDHTGRIEVTKHELETYFAA
ncbi:hypothetical protein [Salinigranum salinum]|uniref:hypothetical protein n=1 Tax=Salinigranum salinum TaxID=1364937 RepID=UPI00186479DC|nr:hypothetical protein [Salinigranum salinum]